MTNNKTPIEEIIMKLDFEVFGLLSDLALMVEGEEIETKVQEIQAIIEDKFSEVRKGLNSQLQAEKEKHMEIFRWLLGYTDFPAKQEGDGDYYWRKGLRQKLESTGIDFKKEVRENE